MAKQNAYLAKQEAVQRQCFNDGWELGTQQMCDYISLALRDPEIMGKDTFSGTRILKVLRRVNEIMQEFRPAFLQVDEADYYQERLDKAPPGSVQRKRREVLPVPGAVQLHQGVRL